jgi:toxin YoeB
MYKIELLPQALRDLQTYKKAGNKSALKKILDIIMELESHPTIGTGQPEPLKYELTGYWSRRIDRKNRMI